MIRDDELGLQGKSGSDLAPYTVPGVERLYLVGPFLHPGGDVYGASRATAMKVMEELRLDFDKMAKAKVS